MYIIKFLTALTMLLAVWSCGGGKQQAAASGSRLTEARIEKEIIDLGELKLHRPADAVFRITNTGKEPLQLASVTPDCHCTAAAWDTQPIAPGGFTLVKATYDSSIPGTFQKLIQVAANVENSPLVLIIRGNVVQ